MTNKVKTTDRYLKTTYKLGKCTELELTDLAQSSLSDKSLPNKLHFTKERIRKKIGKFVSRVVSTILEIT